ncbi:hypothetical protein LR48_Vigan205s005200 [Vigna angularis]|uniref:Uncharacterized protein n=1 Tax=Phaseolus angularis TaxID=3914 RepID=A0A0L9T5N7_PHAAN|nr:hypothetical protein LR48_Vigan205s005200 [Vigna angularis]
MHMLNIARLNDEVHLYVVHNTMEPQIIEMIDWVDGDVNDEGDVARQVEGEVHGEVEGQVEVGTKIEEGHYEGQVEGQAEVGTKMEQGESEVAKQIEHVEEGEVHDVEEVVVHDVNDFELEYVEEDENEDDHVDEAEDEAGDDGQDEGGDDVEDKDEDVDDGHKENVQDDEDEDVDESMSEESLVDVTIECDIGTSKENVREEQPCTPVGESSRTTDNDSMHDVRGLFDIEWVSDELDSGPDSEEEGTM